MRRSFIGGYLGVLFFVVLPVLSGQEQKQFREPDVIFVPTPHEVVDKMLEMADVRPGEIVYDLGCGDGRIPVAAAKKFGMTPARISQLRKWLKVSWDSFQGGTTEPRPQLAVA